MKKAPALFAALLMLTLAAICFNMSGCSKDAGYKDGIYFAQGKSFDPESGWKSVVTLEVKDGQIVSADWNGANIKAGPDKKTASKTGKYPMVEYGKAQSEWHVQAKAAEDYLLKTQDPAGIKYKDDAGHTDAISGVSIKVKDFFSLAAETLKTGPSKPGMFKDGYFHAEQADFEPQSGWKQTADFTVINGYVVAANWNGVHKDGGKDKKTASMDGEYGMVTIGKAKAPWYEQAAETENYFVANQGKAPSYKDKAGRTDAISGVSIMVAPLFELGKEALKER